MSSEKGCLGGYAEWVGIKKRYRIHPSSVLEILVFGLVQ